MLSRSTHFTPEQITLFAGVGAAFFAISARYYYNRAQATLHWRPVEGTITWSTVDDKPPAFRNGVGPQVYYRPDIRYSYTVEGIEYSGSRVYYGSDDWVSSDTVARQLVDRHPPGRVRVFVDPENPNQTVLERGQQQTGRHELHIAIALAVVSVLAFVFRASLRSAL